MDRRLDRRSVVVEWLGRGRAVIMTADGAFREVKLRGRLARRGADAIGHELRGLRPYPISAGALPRLIPGKRLGWAAMAAVFAGLVLGTPVRGWLLPFAQVAHEPSEYRLTTTINGGHALGDARPYGARLVVPLAPAPGAAVFISPGSTSAIPAATSSGTTRLTTASDGFILSPAQTRNFTQTSVALRTAREPLGDGASATRAQSASARGTALRLVPAPPVAHPTLTARARRVTVAEPRLPTSRSERWATHASR